MSAFAQVWCAVFPPITPHDTYFSPIPFLFWFHYTSLLHGGGGISDNNKHVYKVSYEFPPFLQWFSKVLGSSRQNREQIYNILYDSTRFFKKILLNISPHNFCPNVFKSCKLVPPVYVRLYAGWIDIFDFRPVFHFLFPPPKYINVVVWSLLFAQNLLSCIYSLSIGFMTLGHYFSHECFCC